MKTMKTLIVVMVCSLVVTFGTSAFAEDYGWYECSIVKTGIGGSNYYVFLNGTKLSGASEAPTINTAFTFHPIVTDVQENQMIAAILTALNAGLKVEALVHPTITNSLYALYVRAN
jgi:hypothetical protein